MNNTNMNTNKKIGFIYKLVQILEDYNWRYLIQWNPDGHGFIVVDHEEFSRIVLPKYFKHNKFSSFTRQLHLYGFSLLKASSSNNMIVTHPDFVRGRDDLLSSIKRLPGKKTIERMVKVEKTDENESNALDSLRMQLDELRQQNRILVEDNRILREEVDTYRSSSLPDSLFETGIDQENSYFAPFSPLPVHDFKEENDLFTIFPYGDKFSGLTVPNSMDIDPLMGCLADDNGMEAGEMFFPRFDMPESSFGYGF